jgi:hypothetical protein
MKRLVILTALAITAVGFSNKNPSDKNLLKAIHIVESNGRTGKIYGDSGRALGPLQIHYANWKDAVEFDKSIKGKYSDCQELNYSVKVFNAYIKKYAKGKSAESKARIWNGGPDGEFKASTYEYWKKVKANL